MADWRCDSAFVECLERLEWELQHLGVRETEWSAAKQKVRARQDRMSRAERAFCFVYVAGALEDLFRKLDDAIAEDLQDVEVRPRDLRPSVVSVLFPKAWDLINTDRVIRLVKRRTIVETANNFYSTSEPIDLSELKQLGLSDGRTVNTHHFEALWEGMCLSPAGDSIWLSDRHRQAFVSLADKRNTIAHFETDPRDEAFRFSYRDLHDLVSRVEETVERLREHVLLWLDQYKKP